MEPSSVSLVCPRCDEKTPFRRIQDTASSVVWTCGACGYDWEASPLKVHNIGHPRGRLILK
jgi:ribosomal protein L37AE/L43A